MPNSVGRGPVHSDEEAEAIATRAVKAGVREVFKTLGFDIDNPDHIARWHKNDIFLERLRIADEKRNADRPKLILGGVVTVCAALVASLLTGAGRYLLDHIPGVKP